MKDKFDSESGFVGNPEEEFVIKTGFTDVEILRISDINIIARGRRYGRYWLLKGLIAEKRSSPVALRRLQKEFEIHSRLCNPGVAQAVGFEQVPELGMCIVEEWIEGKSLASVLSEGKLSKIERRKILLEIISVVDYVHSQGIVHRNLKPSNIMLRNAGGGVVLIDFGLADTDDYAELKQGAGTPGYISPEQQIEGGANVTDDIYSLGVIMREVCPDYSSIARKCTGPLKKRPNDTKQLLKIINQKRRLPKLVVGCVASVAVLGLAWLATTHMFDLRDAVQDANSKVVALDETNRYHELHTAVLNDSLVKMSERVKNAQEEIRRIDDYNEAKAQAIVTAHKMINIELKDFHNRIVPMFSLPSHGFYDSITALHTRLQYICDHASDAKNFPNVRMSDQGRINNEAVTYYLNQFAKFYTLWQAKIYGNEVKKNGLPEIWPPENAMNSAEREALTKDYLNTAMEEMDSLNLEKR